MVSLNLAVGLGVKPGGFGGGGDIVAPLISDPTSTSVTGSGATIGFSTDEIGGVAKAVILPYGDTVPTKDQIMNGLDAVGNPALAVASITGPVFGANTAAVTGLDDGNQFDFHWVHEDEAGNRSNIIGAAFTTLDTTAPILTSPTGVATGPTTATGVVTTDSGDGTAWRYTSLSGTPPSQGDLVDGTGAEVHVTATVSSPGVINFLNLSALTAGQTYWNHYLHRDSNNNYSLIVSSDSFTQPTETYDVLIADNSELTTFLAQSDATISGLVAALADGVYTPPDINGRTFAETVTFTSLNKNTYGGGALIKGWKLIGSTNVRLEYLDVNRDFTVGVNVPWTGHLYIDGCTAPQVHRCRIYGTTFPTYTAYDHDEVLTRTGGLKDWQLDTAFWYAYRYPKAQHNFFGIANVGDPNVGALFTENKIEYCYSGIRCKYHQDSIVRANLVGPFYNTGIHNAGSGLQDVYTTSNHVFGGTASVEDYGTANPFEAEYANEHTDSSDGFNTYLSFDPAGASQWNENTVGSVYAEIQVGGGRNVRLRIEFVGAGTYLDSDPVTNTGGEYVAVAIEDFTIPAGVTAIRVGILNEAGSGQSKMTHIVLGSRDYGPHSSLYAFTPGTKTIPYTNINYTANIGTATALRGDHSFMKLDDLSGDGSYVNCSMVGNIGESHANIGMEICNPDGGRVENNLMFSTRPDDTPDFKATNEAATGPTRAQLRYANNITGLLVNGGFDILDLNNQDIRIGGSAPADYASAFAGSFTNYEIVTDPLTKFAPKAGGIVDLAQPTTGPVNTIVAWPPNFLTEPSEATVTDDQPDKLLINDVVNAPLDSTVTSNTATFVGLTTAASFHLITAGFSYIKNGGAAATADTTFAYGDTIAFTTDTSAVEDDVQVFYYAIDDEEYAWIVTNTGTYTQVRAQFDAGGTTEYRRVGKIMVESEELTIVGTVNFDASLAAACRLVDIGGRIYIQRFTSGNVQIVTQENGAASIFASGSIVTLSGAMPDHSVDYHFHYRVVNTDGARSAVFTVEVGGVKTEYDLFALFGAAAGTEGLLYTDGTSTGIGSNAGGTSTKVIGQMADVWIGPVARPFSDFFDVDGNPLPLTGYTAPAFLATTETSWETGTHEGTAGVFTSVGITAA